MLIAVVWDGAIDLLNGKVYKIPSFQYYRVFQKKGTTWIFFAHLCPGTQKCLLGKSDFFKVVTFSERPCR